VTDPLRAIHFHFGKEFGAEGFFVRSAQAPSAALMDSLNAREVRMARKAHKNVHMTRTAGKAGMVWISHVINLADDTVLMANAVAFADKAFSIRRTIHKNILLTRQGK
jgi:hypothetical protein